MLELVVIVGAGLSGRGYLARQFSPDLYRLVFIDKDPHLIGRLKEQGRYRIGFFGGRRKPVTISGYEALLTGDPGAEELLRQAAYIFTCVGEQNLREAGDYLSQALGQSSQIPKVVIAAENGTGAARILREGITAQGVRLCECLMLCTTIGEKGSLHILSEDVDHLPYNREACDRPLPFGSFAPFGDFSTLVKRKIYTYNTLSACIAYPGFFKGYDSFGQAANDPEIFALTDRLEASLNQAIAREYGIPRREQEEFSQMAKRKFRNLEIEDSVARNARDVRRKLGPGDRIAAPLALMMAHRVPAGEMELVAAAALLYGIQKGGIDAAPGRAESLKAAFIRLSGIQDERLAAAVAEKAGQIAAGRLLGGPLPKGP